ncbi:hypothetical protein [Sinorhizobium meliloti]|uniref:hypothetical protein n=1 Tax=Rhizobium meliloti TaxID=382 RepID=UPI000FE1193D|nr:hypothetical protein [Sinorhizobium meliloti]RVL90333.1 hypothetical protein CN136_32275 [Sinorhizobium meliloti]
MTLGELIALLRPHLEDESVGIRRSWEETFRYTLRHYHPDILLCDFDLEVLAERMSADGMNEQFVDGYVNRWHGLLRRVDEL